MEVKMDLTNEVVTYINHKVTLSRVSKWYSVNPQHSAIKTCDSFKRGILLYLKSAGSKELARNILIHKKDLENILPNPNNKSYKNSFKKYHEIINYCNELLSTKTSQTNEELKF